MKAWGRRGWIVYFNWGEGNWSGVPNRGKEREGKRNREVKFAMSENAVQIRRSSDWGSRIRRGVRKFTDRMSCHIFSREETDLIFSGGRTPGFSGGGNSQETRCPGGPCSSLGVESAAMLGKKRFRGERRPGRAGKLLSVNEGILRGFREKKEEKEFVTRCAGGGG